MEGDRRDGGGRGAGLSCGCVNWEHVGKYSRTVTEQESH